MVKFTAAKLRGRPLVYTVIVYFFKEIINLFHYCLVIYDVNDLPFILDSRSFHFGSQLVMSHTKPRLIKVKNLRFFDLPVLNAIRSKQGHVQNV
jgi:hypothetical protein